MSGVVTAVVSVAATVVSSQQQAKAAKKGAEAQREVAAGNQAIAEQQKLANEAQGRSASVDAQRERIKQVRESRIARGRVVAATEGIGIDVGSSGSSGAIGSISSQAGYNIGNINQTQSFAQEASDANQRAADIGANVGISVSRLQGEAARFQANAGIASAVAGVSGSIFTASGGSTSLFSNRTRSAPGSANTPIRK